MKKVVVLYSGGLDGRVLLEHAIKEGHDIVVMAFHYGQVHERELQFALNVCSQMDIPITILESPALRAISVKSSLVIGSKSVEKMEDLTPAVPNRNMILLSYAVAYAETFEFEEVWFGPHVETGPSHPDCSLDFVREMNSVVSTSTKGQVHVKAPFIHMTRGDIIKLGKDYGVDFNQTWTCFEGENLSCGKCNACLGRLDGFREAGIADPIRYQSAIRYDH